MAGWKVWECSKCGKKFDEKREHQVFNPRDREFECPKCGKPANYYEEILDEE